MNTRLKTAFLACAVLMALMSAVVPGKAEAAPFLGEIRWVAFNFAPKGWAFCDGQLLSPSQYPDLFALMGKTYGGDGVTTFALPDMRSRAPIHVSLGYPSDHPLGQRGGAESHILSLQEIPAHTHAFYADPVEASDTNPAGRTPAKTAAGTPAYGAGQTVSMAPDSISSSTGVVEAYPNMKPYITLNCIMSLSGTVPLSN